MLASIDDGDQARVIKPTINQLLPIVFHLQVLAALDNAERELKRDQVSLLAPAARMRQSIVTARNG
jgi:hypothetical protein